MSNVRLPLVAILLFSGVMAHAGPLADLFDRKAKPAGPEQVGELVNTLQTDANPGKRARAAEELAHCDGQAYPEVLAALVHGLQHDANATVRREAAQALGRLRPASTEAAQALDQAVANDESALVRLQARTSRLGYHAPAPAPATNPPATGLGAMRKAPVPPTPNNIAVPPATTQPLPKPPANTSDPANPEEPPKFLPEDLPRLLPPLPKENKEAKEKKESKSEEGGGILVAPKPSKSDKP